MWWRNVTAVFECGNKVEGIIPIRGVWDSPLAAEGLAAGDVAPCLRCSEADDGDEVVYCRLVRLEQSIAFDQLPY
jgi:hypothetical protein